MIAERTKQVNSRLLKVAVAIDKALAGLPATSKNFVLTQIVSMAERERTMMLNDEHETVQKGEVINE